MALGVVLLLIPIRDVIGLANSVVVLTAVVIGAGLLGGSAAGATAGVIATFGVSAAHVAPYWQLRFDGVEDVLTGVLLVAAGVLVGKVAPLLRSRQQVRARHVVD